jgi:hypothetical protein
MLFDQDQVAEKVLTVKRWVESRSPPEPSSWLDRRGLGELSTKWFLQDIGN